MVATAPRAVSNPSMPTPTSSETKANGTMGTKVGGGAAKNRPVT